MKKSLSLLLAIAMVFSMFATPVMAADNEAELDAQAKFEALKELGIFEGDANTGDAALDREMTRAEAAVIITKLFDLDVSNPPANPTFPDVEGGENGHWAYEYIEAAAKAGIINGRTNGQFNPGTQEEVEAGVGHVTLYELAVMLTLGLENFTELSIDENAKIDGTHEWAQKYVAAAVEWGLIPSQSDYNHNAIREELVEASYEVKKQLDAAALTVESIEVVDANNLDVTFSDGETVRVELEEALKANVEQTITFTYQGKEFTEKVTLESVIAVNSAKALSEKVIEVKLNQEVSAASAKDFSVVTKEGVKTDDDEVIKVSNARLADYDSDNKTVYVETDSLEPGALYEVEAANGTKAQFVGVSRDKGQEPEFSARADGHDKVEIEFREPIEVASNAKYTVKVYNSNNDLKVSDVNVGQEKIVLTVDEMKSSELYEVTIDGKYTNMEGVAGKQNSYVFQGRDINDTKYEVVSAELTAEDVLVVQIANDKNIVDWDQALNPDNYVIEKYFGGGDRIKATEAVVVNRDNSKLALFLDEKTSESELYTVTLRNMKTRYGFGIEEEPLDSAVFYGIPEDNEKLGFYVTDDFGKIINFDGVPTKMSVTFNDLLDEEFAVNKANYKLVNLSEDEEVDIEKVEINNNDVTKHSEGSVYLYLPEELDEDDVYELSVKNLRDKAGNGFEDQDSLVFTLDQASGQKVTQKAIEEIKSVNYKLDGRHHKVTLTFNSHVDKDNAENVTNYYIKDLGYPYNVSHVQNDVVELQIPEPVQGEIYTITAKNMINRHGVSMKGDKVEAKFAATSGLAAGAKPSFVAARIVDKQTVALHFDGDVKGEQFANFYDEENFLIADVYTYERGKENNKQLLNNARVFFDGNNDNVIYVRTPESVFDSGYRYVSIEQSGFLHEDSAKEHAFAGVGIDPIAPNILKVISQDSKTITVTYNVPVEKPNPANYWINDDIGLEKVVKVSDLVYQFVLEDGKEIKTGLHKLSVNAENLLDSTGFVQADKTGETITREFAGRATAPGSIKNLTLVSQDKYTFQVRYPEAMDKETVENSVNYSVYGQGSDTLVATGGDFSAIHYDEDTRTATLYSTVDLSKDYRILDLEISQDVTNALGTRSIDKDYEGRLVTRTNDPIAPKLTYKSAKVDSDGNYEVVVTLDKPIESLALDQVDLVKDSLKGSSRNVSGIELSEDGLTLTLTGNNSGMTDYSYYAVILKASKDEPLFHAHNGASIEKDVTLEGTLVFKRN